MQPSLEEIQHSLNRGSQMIVEVTKQIYQWGQTVVKTAPPVATAPAKDSQLPANNGTPVLIIITTLFHQATHLCFPNLPFGAP